MRSEDITGKSHWDTVYTGARPAATLNWEPVCYADRCLAHMLMTQVRKRKPRSILEVGCGNSTWLPWLAAKTGVATTGIDYSEQGCELARRNLADSGIEARVLCGDIFDLSPEAVGSFDLVYSLGVVEHFANLDTIVSTLSSFVAPEGALLTEVPNLSSLHGVMAHLYQPELLAKHKVITVPQLVESYRKVGLSGVDGGRLGIFSMGIVAWGIEQRLPKLDPVILPLVRVASRVTDEVLGRVGCFKGAPALAPFLYVVGTK